MLSGGRALGLGLLAGAGVILLLLILWLAVSGATSGGIVLGLLLALIIAGPLAGGGWYVLSRQPTEQRAAEAFARKQRILDADRVFRAQLADALRDLAARPDVPSAELRGLADDLLDASHSSLAWQELVQLDDSSFDTLRRYDDLVRERVRRLRDQPTNAPAALRELRRAVDQREDLLTRGQVPPEVSPSQILDSATSSDPTTEALQRIGLGDAVTFESVDYVVERLAEYFAESQRWRLAQLSPSESGAATSWLYVGPGGQEFAWLADISSAAPATPGPELTEEASGTAVVDVSDRQHTAQGILVSYRRSRGASRLAFIQTWPDATTQTFTGPLIRPSILDFWPASSDPSAT